LVKPKWLNAVDLEVSGCDFREVA